MQKLNQKIVHGQGGLARVLNHPSKYVTEDWKTYLLQFQVIAPYANQTLRYNTATDYSGHIKNGSEPALPVLLNLLLEVLLPVRA